MRLVPRWCPSAIRVTLGGVQITPKQTAETLRRCSAEARLQAESHARAARERALAVVKTLLPDGARAWLIGSLAWGGFGERSDVDLVLEGVDGRTSTAIEIAVCRAVRAEVDLLTFESLPVSFRAKVEREGIAIHGS